jgi:beta-lactamase regulating signal transducer with metallopeptidase domain
MTNDLVLDLARAHLAFSLLILLVLAVRRPVRTLVGPRVAYALWLLPLIAALAVLLPPRIDYATALPAASSVPLVQTVAAPTPALAADPAPLAPAIDLWQVILVLWAVGAAASLSWLIIQQLRYLGFARLGAAGPAVVGFWRPRVVLPVDFEERYSTQERVLILAHESTHLKRQDPRVIGLALTLRSLAWFNPLAYIAVTKLRIDQELACDEAVVSCFPRSRRVYADALAKSQLAIRPLPLGCYWPSGTEHPLLERLSMLKTSRIGARSRIAGAGVLALLCAATGLAAWSATPAEVRYVSPEPAPAPAPAASPTPGPTPQVAMLQPAAAPAAQAAPPMPNLSSGMRDTVNADEPVTFSGVIERMEWVSPSSVITFRDASGEVRRVITDSPSTLQRGGVDQNSLAVGSVLSGEGYASKDGVMLFASPVAMTTDGAPLFPDAAAYAREQALRNTLCGAPPPAPGPISAEVAMTLNAWNRECEAKVVAGLAGETGGEASIVETSIFTNSMIREGSQ